jgi:LysM repeat protein
MNLYDFFSNKKINLTENLVSASDIEKQVINENLHKWFKEKWVRFGPDGKIRGDCARGDDSEGKPKCLPQSKAHSLGKKGRASAASRKRREDPNPERRGAAINVATKKESISEEAFYEKLIMLEYKLAEAGKASAMGTSQRARDTRANLRATSVNPPTASAPATTTTPTRRGAMPRAGTPGAYYVANEPTPTPPAPRPPGTTASGVVRPAPTTGVSTDLPSKLSGGGSDNDYSRAPELDNLPLPSSAVVTSPMPRTTPSDNRPAVQATSLPAVGREMPSAPSATEPTDDQLAAAADLATGGYSGGKKTEPTASSATTTTTTPSSSYTIQRGDTLSKIAQRFGTTTQELMRLNPEIKNPNRIFAGKKLRTPEATPYPSDSGVRVGQAPTIDDETRRRAKLSVAPDQSDAETARLTRSITQPKTQTTTTSSEPSRSLNDRLANNTQLKQNLTPEQLKWTGGADLVDNVGVVSRMPLPSTEEMSEVTRKLEGNKSYDVAYGDVDSKGKVRNLNKLPTAEEWSEKNLGTRKKLSDMTVSELMRFQSERPEGQNAVGAYQFVPKTLKALIKKEGIDPNQKFDKATQDKLNASLMLENGKTLQSNGIVPDKVNIYMAHRLGAPATLSLYKEVKSNPEKSVADLTTDLFAKRNKLNPNNPAHAARISKYKTNILKNNPDFNRSIGSFYDHLSSKINTIKEQEESQITTGNAVYKINEQGFQFSPEQEKWLGGANRQDPSILSRMPGPKPPSEYFNNSDDQKIAQQIAKSHELADKWQQFRQGGSLLSKALRRVPGVNQAANVVDVGANVVKGDFATAGRQALGMIPAAKPLNVALQAGDVIGNVKKGDYASGLSGALGLAAGQGNETAAKAVKGLSTFDKIKNASQKISNFTNKEQTMENTCPHCGGIALDDEILAEKKDACYHKVKSRYKVWPSAYASGALVKCRKKGAKNWGKSKTNEDTNLYFNVVGTDKKTLISEFKLQHNARGWYLNENSPSSLKLDAVRAFGMPLSEEELNPIAYDGTAATIGTDNGKSPVGSIPKSQRINKRRGKV